MTAKRTTVALLSAAIVMFALAVSDASTSNHFDAYAFYEPYNNLLRVDYKIDANLWHDAGENSAQLDLVITDSSGKKLCNHRWDLIGPEFGVQVKEPLDPGKFQATIHLISPGGNIAAQAGNQISNANYRFEKNNIGQQRVVIPPFEKITVNHGVASVWGRQFEFAPTGLPSRIIVLGRSILADPGVQVIAMQDGQSLDLKPRESSAITTTDGYDATSTSQGTISNLHYRLACTLDYDGFYLLRLTVENPSAVPIPIDRLFLLIPFADPVDTYSFQKNDRDFSKPFGLSRFDAIPPQQAGTIFDARQLPSKSAYNMPAENSFVPSIYVGTGTRGLWYYSADDWDWYLNPKNEQATLERVNGQVRLRILFVNDRVSWTGTRTFEFALMPQPVKPLPADWRSIAWGWPHEHYYHDRAGYRYYGDGVDAFSLPTDQDYQRLGQVLDGSAPAPKNSMQPLVRSRGNPMPYVLYGSNLMAGFGPANGEWNTYGPEWAGSRFYREPVEPATRRRFATRQSYGGFSWSDDISLKPCIVNWTDSWLDFALYYQQKLVQFANVNGTWMDNQSSFTIPAYTEDGLDRHLIENPNRYPSPLPLDQRPADYGRRYHIFQFRQYLKRLSTMCYLLGRQPMWVVNQQPTWSFAQIAWHIEADYYTENGERDLLDRLGIDGFRAHVNTQGGLIPRLESNSVTGVIDDQPPIQGRPDRLLIRVTDATEYLLHGVKRTNAGLCLLHDIGMTMPDELLSTKLASEGFFDPDVEFHGYWDQHDVHALTPFYVSLFKHPGGRKILAVVMNASNDPVTAPLQMSAQVCGLNVSHIRDIESSETFRNQSSNSSDISFPLYLPARDFRVLSIEQ